MPPPDNHSANGATPPPRDDDLAKQGQRMQELIERIETLPDPAARALLQECMESVLAFYGGGLARVLDVVQAADPDKGKVFAALLDDISVRGLLLIHGLHPVDLEGRLLQALAKVRPYMESHGGNVELISLENDFALLRLVGHCKTCPSSTVTLELAVRQAIEEACPDLQGFEVEGVPDVADTAPPVHQPNAAPKWTVLADPPQLENGAFKSLYVAGAPVLLCQLDGQLYAYRDHCPACNLPLHLGVLNDGVLSCRANHRYDARHAGRGLDNPASHLDPFPLLTNDGVVKVAVSSSSSP